MHKTVWGLLLTNKTVWGLLLTSETVWGLLLTSETVWAPLLTSETEDNHCQMSGGLLLTPILLEAAPQLLLCTEAAIWLLLNAEA